MIIVAAYMTGSGAQCEKVFTCTPFHSSISESFLTPKHRKLSSTFSIIHIFFGRR